MRQHFNEILIKILTYQIYFRMPAIETLDTFTIKFKFLINNKDL